MNTVRTCSVRVSNHTCERGTAWLSSSVLRGRQLAGNALNLFKPRAGGHLHNKRESLTVSVPPQSLATSSQNIEVPRHLLRKRTPLFCARIVLAMLIIAGSSACIMTANPLLMTIGIIVQGAMYVHLIELQHSVLHLHAFSNHRINRLIGFLLGLPMMISFSDFQYKHLRHHKYLGTKLNNETFDYKHHHLNSLWGFVHGALDYSRIRTLQTRIMRAFQGEQMSDGQNPLMETRIAQEYRLFGIALAGATCLCLIESSPWPLLVWLLPFLAAEPVHFLLELPEHFGLPAHSNPSVFLNTRAWGGSWFAHWYTHYTNFHVAHHFNQLIPMDNLPELQKYLDPHIPQSSRSDSYPAFWLEVMRGEIHPDPMD